VVLNAMAAYALMKKELPGNRFLVYYLVILPMLFSGGLVPTYLTIKSLGLIDKFAVLILPVLIKGWSIALIRNYYLTIPASLLESARIDGAKEMSVFSKIMVPLSKPVLAAMSIFTGVSYWNSFFSAVIYINSPQKYTFPVKLREMIIVQYDMSGQLIEVAKMAAGQSSLPTSLLQEGLTSAVIVISILPIALIYPFLQKYFTKGILLSSLKE
jgi:ABC-type glycerol-3-phosphate transport system permease component